MKAWMKREQWFIWIAAAVVVIMVLAATIGSYMEGWWDFL
jgi:ABC-type phosphate transport system auxiliary subunit